MEFSPPHFELLPEEKQNGLEYFISTDEVCSRNKAEILSCKFLMLGLQEVWNMISCQKGDVTDEIVLELVLPEPSHWSGGGAYGHCSWSSPFVERKQAGQRLQNRELQFSPTATGLGTHPSPHLSAEQQ